VTDEAITGHVAKVVEGVIAVNGGGHGDYLLVVQASNGEDGLMFTWQWAWSPQVPKHTGKIEPSVAALRPCCLTEPGTGHREGCPQADSEQD